MKRLSMVLRAYRISGGDDIKARCYVPVIRETKSQYIVDGMQAEMVKGNDHYRYEPRHVRIVKKTGRKLGCSSPMLNTWRCEAVIEETP